MTTNATEIATHPIKDMLADIASSRGFMLRDFLPDASGNNDQFPILDELSRFKEYLTSRKVLSLNAPGLVAFEGSNGDLGLAYVGKKGGDQSARIWEQGLIRTQGRSIWINLREDTFGDIEIYDGKVDEAAGELRKEGIDRSYLGVIYTRPTSFYGFTREDTTVETPGVKAFLEHMIS